MIRKIDHSNLEGENSPKLSSNTTKASFLITLVSIMLVSSFLIQITSITPAEALTRYYNCLARVANNNATLEIANVDACYNLIFKGALDYYGIKQTSSSSDDKDTNSEDDSPADKQTSSSSDDKDTNSEDDSPADKQTSSSSDDKDTNSEDDSPADPKGKLDNNEAKTQSEKVQETPDVYDVFK
jgi:hypothetical protein